MKVGYIIIGKNCEQDYALGTSIVSKGYFGALTQVKVFFYALLNLQRKYKTLIRVFFVC